MLRGKTTALERNRIAQARPRPAMEHDRQRSRADEIIE
jgi:hypothetical protein